MEFANSEKVDMLEVYFLCGKNSSLAANQYAERYPDRATPNRKMFTRLVGNLRLNGSFLKKRQCQPRVVTQDVEADILAYFEVHPKASIRNVARLYHLSFGSIQKILRKNNYHPYKFTPVQALMPGDEGRRVTFCAWLAEEFTNNPGFLHSIIWTDETNFSNNGMFNRKNNHYWSTENPLVVRERNHQVRFSINCWCAILGNRVLAVHFYHGNLTGARYLELLEEVLLPAIDDLPLNVRMQLMFQQDGAPPHNAHEATDFLNGQFPGRVIATNGNVAWPARSPDLSPLDFFLWGHLKNELYIDRYASVEEMCNKVMDILHNIHHNTLARAVNDLNRRAHACIYEDGGHIEHLL